MRKPGSVVCDLCEQVIDTEAGPWSALNIGIPADVAEQPVLGLVRDVVGGDQGEMRVDGDRSLGSQGVPQPADAQLVDRPDIGQPFFVVGIGIEAGSKPAARELHFANQPAHRLGEFP